MRLVESRRKKKPDRREPQPGASLSMLSPASAGELGAIDFTDRQWAQEEARRSLGERAGQ
jgi:hypothetical protein